MEDNEMDGYMEFFYQFNQKSPAVSIRLSPDTALPEVFEAFEQFLRGAGYSFNGQIDLVDDVPQDSQAEYN